MEPVTGSIGERVAAVRKRRGLSQRALSARLEELGHKIAPSGIAKIESDDPAARRGVDVDDLVALAVALNVSPARLLLPDSAGDEEVALTPARSAPAWAAWAWAEGRAPLPTRSLEEELNTDEEVRAYELERPAELIRREEHPAARAARDLFWRVQRVVHHATKPKPKKKSDVGFATTIQSARRALDRVVAELDDMEEERRGNR